MKKFHPDSDPAVRACDSEPIHIPGSIQPHGVLFALDSDSFRVIQVSANTSLHLSIDPDTILGGSLSDCLEAESAEILFSIFRSVNIGTAPRLLDTVYARDHKPFHAIAHCHDGVLVVELESHDLHNVFTRDLHPLVSGFVTQLQGLNDRQEVLEAACEQIQRITEFDRVLVYEFDAEWNGSVIAECRNQVLPSYLDLRFPASDIPSQARDLYRINSIRLIPDANYEPVPILPAVNPKTRRPLDLSFAGLRSVSPVHRGYMRNMGTAASMSISILRDSTLWGLISCHNKAPHHVRFEIRRACEFITQVASVHIATLDHTSEYAEQIRLKGMETLLLTRMAQHERFPDGLSAARQPLLDFVNAQGAAVLHEGDCALLGETPNEAQVRQLADWISQRAPSDEVFKTDHLAGLMPDAETSAPGIAGILGIRISKLHDSYLLWFRPEVVQTVRWGGDPNKPVSSNGDLPHARKNFDLWKEVVRGHSLPWRDAEVTMAYDLRNAIVGVVLRKAEEMAEISSQLERSNKELEAFSYSVSHDLRAPFRHIVGYAELLREREEDRLSAEGQRYVRTIIESAQYAGTLVDNLLNFSRIGRSAMNRSRISMKQLVRELQYELGSESRGRTIQWNVAELPDVTADPILLRLAVRNLLSNALKYTRNRSTSEIQVGSRDDEVETVFWVRDNGVGFDMRYVDKLFGVFQRLHRMEDFEGTGIGLANVRRIIGRHGGRTWAESELGNGATFFFTLPVSQIMENNCA